MASWRLEGTPHPLVDGSSSLSTSAEDPEAGGALGRALEKDRNSRPTSFPPHGPCLSMTSFSPTNALLK